jgi:hypothetical protein
LAAAIIEPTWSALLQAAANKLRLKKKEVTAARMFVWRTGVEIPRDSTDVHSVVFDGELIVVAYGGEPFAGRPAGVAGGRAPSSEGTGTAGAGCSAGETELQARAAELADLVAANPLHGNDDAGGEYPSMFALWEVQARRRSSFYAANDAWWGDAGYGGATDEAAMIGDDGSAADVRSPPRGSARPRPSPPWSLRARSRSRPAPASPRPALSRPLRVSLRGISSRSLAYSWTSSCAPTPACGWASHSTRARVWAGSPRDACSEDANR